MVTQSHADHTVQVYETDGYLSQRVVEFLQTGLKAGDRGVVIATRPHRELFAAGLKDAGIDVDAAISAGDLALLDANDMLARFMVDGVPDAARFHATIGPAIGRAARGGRPVRAFGEMVDILWRDGHADAALALERLWNDLAQQHKFQLLCAYTLQSLYKTSSGRFREICEVHDHAHPPEIESADDNTRLLISEIARRANVERELRDTIRALQRSEEAERNRATRAAKLQHATAALASAVSIGELCDTLIATASHLVGANAAVVYLADADGKFRLCGALNLPDIKARWATLPLDAPLPLARALATATSQWIERRERMLELFPTLSEPLLAASKTHAAVALPFIHAGTVIGGIALSFETQRTFTEEERTWLESFAAQATLAIRRVRQHVAEHKARSEAENLLRIAESLNDMHLDLEAILQRVTDEATALVGAQFGAFFYNVKNDRGESYMLYTLSGARKEQFAKLGMPRNTAIFSQTFDGIGVVRLDDVKQDPRYGKMAPHHGMPAGHLPVTSYLAIPVRSRTGEVIGGLFFGHEEAAKFTAQHENTLRGLAVTAAIALDNAELYRAARDAEDAQRKTVEQLSEQVRMNELFTGVLAHDLRSPLAAVTTATELLEMKSTDADKRVIGRVLTSSRRMARMIEQLLDFTRIRVGTGLPLDCKPCDLQTLLSHVIDEQRAAHPSQPIAFESDGTTTGCWDDDRLAQVFSNLLSNAAQHGQAGGITVHLDGTRPDAVRVTVHNHGVIPGDVIGRMFEPMIGGQRRRDGTRGLGIGLYITHEIAKSHGGAVDAVTSPEAGTTFTITLPREVASVEAAPRAVAAPAAEPSVDSGQRMRALVEGVRDCAIFMLDERAQVQTWTQMAEEITGWTRDAVIGKPVGILYPPESQSVLELELGRAAKLGVSEHDGWYVRQDGAKIWAHVSISAIRGATGKIEGYSTIVRDLTAHHAAGMALEERDARMRLMIDSVRDYAIFVLDADGKVASWNRGAQLAKGYTAGEIIGRSIAEFYTREEREAGRPQQLLAAAVRDGRVEDEGWRVRKDGSRFWADVIITALRDDSGELRGFAKVTRDLTERRRAEDELRRSEERFRLLVESVKDYAIFLLDPTGHIVTWNAGAERNNGYKAHEIVGEHFSRFYAAEEVRAGKCERELEIAIRDGRFEEEGWRFRKDGTRFWANVVITPLRTPNGDILGFAKVTRDLSERKNLEEERMRAVQAQEGIRLRDEFLSIVSHELKTPLAGLLLQIEAAAHRKAIDPLVKDKLMRARQSGERLDNLIETLLDVSRIATGRFVLSMETLDLSTLVRDTVETFQSSATKAGSDLTVELPDKLVGSWDRVRMSQLVANLLSNAIKYGAGGPIHVRLERSGNEAVFSVRDHGPGVDPTMQSRIFERFERAASTRHYGGLGIGLYVVREIVTAHGGTASVENSPDGGARFKIRLPMEQLA